MKIGIWIVIAVMAIIIIYLVMKNSTTSATAATLAANAVPPPDCVPFTQAQQDEQKKELNKECAKLQFTPIIGVFQFTSCIGKVASKLTPVKNC